MSVQPSSCVAGKTALEDPIPWTEMPDMGADSLTEPILNLANLVQQPCLCYSQGCRLGSAHT